MHPQIASFTLIRFICELVANEVCWKSSGHFICFQRNHQQNN